LGELLRALMFGKALKGVLTDVELLAATAVLEHERPHRRGCECEDCEDRLLLGLDPDDEW
jgi:hypothetical protein